MAKLLHSYCEELDKDYYKDDLLDMAHEMGIKVKKSRASKRELCALIEARIKLDEAKKLEKEIFMLSKGKDFNKLSKINQQYLKDLDKEYLNILAELRYLESLMD